MIRESLECLIKRNEAFIVDEKNLWPLFKRCVVGQFHRVSAKQLDRYLEEFTYRFNGWGDTELFQNTLRNLVNRKVPPFEKMMKAA